MQSLSSAKILSVEEFCKINHHRRPVVFTNGCFDILHRGHVDYLERTRALGNTLVVGINSDDSVKKLNKSPERPINSLSDRAGVLAGLQSVDYLIAFEQLTPLELITKIKPDILVKGGDWKVEEIIGNDVVWENGGKVISLPFNFNRSTTNLINKIKKTKNDCH